MIETIEFNEKEIEVEFDYQPREESSGYSPGCSEFVDILGVFENGINIFRDLSVDTLQEIESQLLESRD